MPTVRPVQTLTLDEINDALRKARIDLLSLETYVRAYLLYPPAFNAYASGSRSVSVVAGSWVKLDIADTGSVGRDVTIDTTNDTITVNTPGLWDIRWSWLGEATFPGGAGGTLEFVWFVNGVASADIHLFTGKNTALPVSLSASKLFEVSASSLPITFDLRVRSSTGVTPVLQYSTSISGRLSGAES